MLSNLHLVNLIKIVNSYYLCQYPDANLCFELASEELLILCGQETVKKLP